MVARLTLSLRAIEAMASPLAIAAAASFSVAGVSAGGRPTRLPFSRAAANPA